jgi:hypothetical protein
MNYFLFFSVLILILIPCYHAAPHGKRNTRLFGGKVNKSQLTLTRYERERKRSKSHRCHDEDDEPYYDTTTTTTTSPTTTTTYPTTTVANNEKYGKKPCKYKSSNGRKSYSVKNEEGDENPSYGKSYGSSSTEGYGLYEDNDLYHNSKSFSKVSTKNK